MKKEQQRCCDFRARLGRGRFRTKEWDVSHDTKKARSEYTREKNFLYSKSGYKRERVHVDSPFQNSIAKVGPESTQQDFLLPKKNGTTPKVLLHNHFITPYYNLITNSISKPAPISSMASPIIFLSSSSSSPHSHPLLLHAFL